MEHVTPECPLCGSSHTRFYLHKNSCDIYMCLTCRYRFVHPLPNVEKIYGEQYFEGATEGFGYVSYDRDKEPMVPTFKKYISLLRHHLPGIRTMLDVGAATGFFVEIANKEGVVAEGIELSPFAVDVGKQLGRNIQTGTIGTLATSGSHATYDSITMLDVIEHVPNPEADVQAAHKLLNKGGLLVINTPDTGSVYARLMGKRWHLLTPPEHIAYFDRKNLKMLLERNNFDIVWMGTIGKQFTLSYIFNTLYAWQGLKLWEFLARVSSVGLVSSIRLPINLGDNMFVIARAP